MRRCQDLGPHQRGWYVLTGHIRRRVAPRQQLHAVDHLFAFGSSRRSSKSCMITSESCQRPPQRWFRRYLSGRLLLIGEWTKSFDTAQLLEETLDSIGYPNTTSFNQLRDIVLPLSLVQKLDRNWRDRTGECWACEHHPIFKSDPLEEGRTTIQQQ